MNYLMEFISNASLTKFRNLANEGLHLEKKTGSPYTSIHLCIFKSVFNQTCLNVQDSSHPEFEIVLNIKSLLSSTGMFTYHKDSHCHWFSSLNCDNYSEFRLVGAVSFTAH